MTCLFDYRSCTRTIPLNLQVNVIVNLFPIVVEPHFIIFLDTFHSILFCVCNHRSQTYTFSWHHVSTLELAHGEEEVGQTKKRDKRIGY